MSIFKIAKGQKYNIKGMIDYVINDEKTFPNTIFSKDVIPNNEAWRYFALTHIMFKKSDLNKRWYYQFILSIDKNEDLKGNYQERFVDTVISINNILNCWSNCMDPTDSMDVPKFHVISAIHIDKYPHIHAHFVVNNVSYIDGHQFPLDKKHFWLLLNIVNQVLLYYDFTPIPDKRVNGYFTLASSPSISRATNNELNETSELDEFINLEIV